MTPQVPHPTATSYPLRGEEESRFSHSGEMSPSEARAGGLTQLL